MRVAGVLMPVASLPSRYGIGDFGNESYEFIDRLKAAGVKIWQILPLHPLGYGNSPYQPFSSYAGEELYISIDLLIKEEYLDKQELESQESKAYIKSAEKRKSIDYEAVREWKDKIFRKAYKRFHAEKEFDEFTKISWVKNYAVFMALKKKNGLTCWNTWTKEQRDWIIDRNYDLTDFEEEIRYQMFLQFLFLQQWKALKSYANQNGIKIMGDIPFYVGIDSLDVWEHQDAFLLDKKGEPVYIAGVPPDYFSKTGQRWGNPIYDWEYLKKTDYAFWTERIGYASEIFDIIRIDHFRAFDTYWKIPASCETAIEGEWIEAPGYEVFDTIFKKFPKIQIVVEDLGDLREEVNVLRDHYQFKGMNVVQFSFLEEPVGETMYAKKNVVMYTGTHDNQTVGGWYHSLTVSQKRKVRKKLKQLGHSTKNISWAMVEVAFESGADMTIVPYQDIIGMNDKGRINLPGTLGSPNWEWKVCDFESWDKMARQLKKLVKRSRR